MTAPTTPMPCLTDADDACSLPGGDHFLGMVGNGSTLRAAFSRIQRIAPHFQTALVTGETGTGKELAARALHQLSKGHRGRLVVLNCSAVVEALFESELFGHIRGSFTGAGNDKMGLIEFASGGTLFLDEIGDLPLSMQSKLLRVLQTREVHRIGALEAKTVDFRLVAATNKDLRKAVDERTFRADLFYRLSMVEIHMPPLRERLDDLPALVHHFVREWSQRFDKPIAGVSADVWRALEAHSWPGNIRELENVIGHGCIMADAVELGLGDLPTYLVSAEPPANPESEAVPIPLPATLSDKASDAIDELEIRLVRQALHDSGGNQIRAARLLRTTRDRFRYRMKKYGLACGGEAPGSSTWA